MSVKPPMCKMCGHAHYGIEHVFEGRQATHPLASLGMFESTKTVRKEKRSEPVTERVTDVTKPVTPHLVAPSKLAALQAENEALTAEVAMLKRKLAEAAGGKPKPMTAAERQRKRRAAGKGIR
jgi:hypothetical protein